MNFYNEKVDYENPLLSLRIFSSDRPAHTVCDWHYHREVEVLYVEQGKLAVTIDSEELIMEDGDIIIIGSSQLHRDRTVERCHYTVLQFGLEQFFDSSTMQYMKYFSEAKRPLSDANYIFHTYPEARAQAAEYIRNLSQENKRKQPGYELAVNIGIKQFLLLMLRFDSRQMLAQPDGFDRLRVKPVLDYIESQLGGRIQVEDVCQLANMSYYYFVKFFKKSVGLSFTEYVNYRKIKWAERILLTKDLSISEVGELIGMPNMAHFYKMFKRYNHCSPKEYQRKMLSWNNPDG